MERPDGKNSKNTDISTDPSILYHQYGTLHEEFSDGI